MAFQPVVPLSGLAGLRVLERTYDRQFEAFSNSADIQLDVEYFLENAGSIESSADFVADRRLMKVALGAFGLSSEIDKKALLRKMLDEGTESRTALANKFTDSRYAEFSSALGFGNSSGYKLSDPDALQALVDKYLEESFEEAVGQVDDTMRIALNFKNEILDIAASGTSTETGWLRTLGKLPVRAVLDKAFNLPDQFAQVDIDRQVEVYQERAQAILGEDSVLAFLDPENVDTVLRRYMAVVQAESGPSSSTPGIGALTLLQSSGLGASSQVGLILSNS